MPTRTRKPSAVRRLEIAEAALRVIGEQGAAELTTASLAAAVGLTPGALFRHFASLDDILEAAVDRAIQRVRDTFPAADLPPEERLRSFVQARVELISGTPGLAWLLLSDQVYLSVPKPAIRRLRALVKRSRDFLLTAVREGMAEGTLRSDMEPEVMLVLITGTVHALIGTKGVHRSPTTRRPTGSGRVLDTLFFLLTEERS